MRHVLDLVMSFVLVRYNIEFHHFPSLVDLVQTDLDRKFLCCRLRCLIDLVGILIKSPLDDLLKSELVGLVIECSADFILKTAGILE